MTFEKIFPYGRKSLKNKIEIFNQIIISSQIKNIISKIYNNLNWPKIIILLKHCFYNIINYFNNNFFFQEFGFI